MDQEQITGYQKLGSAAGDKWAAEANPEDLFRAALKMTTNEQLRRHTVHSNSCAKSGICAYGNMMVIPPFERIAWGNAIADFFISAIQIYPEFRESADFEEDPDVITDNGEGSIATCNAYFRAFEDGWALALREYWCRTGFPGSVQNKYTAISISQNCKDVLTHNG